MSELIVNQVLNTIIVNSIIPELETKVRKLEKDIKNTKHYIKTLNY